MNMRRIDPTRLARIASAFVLVISGLSLIGWTLDIAILTRLLPRLPAMVPNTAIAFWLAAISLWCAAVTPVQAARKWLSRTCALGVILISGLTLGQYFFGWQLPLDR